MAEPSIGSRRRPLRVSAGALRETFRHLTDYLARYEAIAECQQVEPGR